MLFVMPAVTYRKYARSRFRGLKQARMVRANYGILLATLLLWLFLYITPSPLFLSLSLSLSLSLCRVIIPDATLPSRFPHWNKIASPLHPRDKAEYSLRVEIFRSKRAASWGSAGEERRITLPAPTRGESISKLIGVYRAITGERDDGESSRIWCRALRT